jgi:hypothetical protein
MLPEQQKVYYPLLPPLTDLALLLLLLLQVDSFPLTAVESKLVFIYWENRKEEEEEGAGETTPKDRFFK